MATTIATIREVVSKRQLRAYMGAVAAQVYTFAQLVALMVDASLEEDQFLTNDPAMCADAVNGLCLAGLFTPSIVAMGSETVLDDWRFTRVELVSATLVEPPYTAAATFVMPLTHQGVTAVGDVSVS